MSVLLLIPGLALPTLSGWLLLRLLEGRSVLLFRGERWILGFLLGTTGMMFATFLATTILSVPLSRVGYLSVQILGTLALGTLRWKIQRRKTVAYHVAAAPKGAMPKWALITLFILGVWTVIKIFSAGMTFSILMPTFFDDSLDNWNLRAKVFYTTQEISLALPNEYGEPVGGGVSSYPPTVSLTKAWLSTLAGEWSEPLVNGVHLLWFLAAIILLFYALRRVTGVGWSLLGTYILTSLPLYLIHGTNAYADVYLSAHILAAISMMFFAVTTAQWGYLRIGAAAAALLIFTKNEALLMYVPVLLLLLACTLAWAVHSGKMQKKEMLKLIVWHAVFLLIILIPWISYKWMNGLTFGNAQSISDISIRWQSGVLYTIWLNTFFEGNWLFFFPLLIGLLIHKRRTAFGSSLLLPSAFILIIYFGQLPLYLFTFLSAEALYQTGYARGLIHLMPVMTMVVTVLLSQCFSQKPPITEE